jgi:hypothetical protein
MASGGLKLAGRSCPAATARRSQMRSPRAARTCTSGRRAVRPAGTRTSACWGTLSTTHSPSGRRWSRSRSRPGRFRRRTSRTCHPCTGRSMLPESRRKTTQIPAGRHVQWTRKSLPCRRSRGPWQRCWRRTPSSRTIARSSHTTVVQRTGVLVEASVFRPARRELYPAHEGFARALRICATTPDVGDPILALALTKFRGSGFAVANQARVVTGFDPRSESAASSGLDVGCSSGLTVSAPWQRTGPFASRSGWILGG